MGNIEPVLWRDLTIIIVFIGGFILKVMNYRNASKRTPHIDTDFGVIKNDLEAIKSTLASKQDETLCLSKHSQLKADITELQRRQTAMEKKQSDDVHGLYERLEEMSKSFNKSLGSLEGTINTYIKLKEG